MKAMFTPEGNRLVAQMIDDIRFYKTRDEALPFIRERMTEIVKAGHGEVYDTVVRESIADIVQHLTKGKIILSIFDF